MQPNSGIYPNLNQYQAGSQPPPPPLPGVPPIGQINTDPSATPYQRPPPTNPTIRPVHPFYPAEDAKRLYKAMKGLGTDETTLIDVLCQRTWPQRQEIAMAYKTAYGKDLQRSIESETSGDFRDVLVALLKPPIVYEAEMLRHSVAGLGTNEDILIDIVCTKSNYEMNEMKNAYRQSK